MVEMYKVWWTKQGSGNFFRESRLSKYRRLLGPRERRKSKDKIQDQKTTSAQIYLLSECLKTPKDFTKCQENKN